MALDSALRRASAVFPLLPWRDMLPFPDGTIATEDRYTVAGLYSGLIATPPALLDQIGNITARAASGTHAYDLSLFFSGATSYAIAPTVETGWSFDTNTGVLTIDTDDSNTFGPYTVTATSAGGSVDSNTFTVRVSAANTPSGFSLAGGYSGFRVRF